ncbi:hypothetical protein Tco_0211253 [Tanacetum coccineum]
MNMLNRNCKTSFVKPEFLKKAQRANPRLYDIGCYKDNLALMLAPESDETIRLAQESRSKLSDLIKPFDYKNLNNLYDLFVPQREKSPEKRYSSVREYYYADHMNAILGVYTKLDEVTNLQCDYLEALEKCQCLENEHSKRNTTSKSFEAFMTCQKRFSELEQHSINLELALQQSQEQLNNDKLGEVILFIVDSRCLKHMTRNLKLLSNFVEKFMGTVKFGNDQIALILGYGDLVQGNVTIKRVYYIEGLNHNLFFVGQFYEADLKVAFRKSTCYIRDLKEMIYSHVLVAQIYIPSLFKTHPLPIQFA